MGIKPRFLASPTAYEVCTKGRTVVEAKSSMQWCTSFVTFFLHKKKVTGVSHKLKSYNKLKRGAKPLKETYVLYKWALPLKKTYVLDKGALPLNLVFYSFRWIAPQFISSRVRRNEPKKRTIAWSFYSLVTVRPFVHISYAVGLTGSVGLYSHWSY